MSHRCCLMSTCDNFHTAPASATVCLHFLNTNLLQFDCRKTPLPTGCCARARLQEMALVWLLMACIGSLECENSPSWGRHGTRVVIPGGHLHPSALWCPCHEDLLWITSVSLVHTNNWLEHLFVTHLFRFSLACNRLRFFFFKSSCLCYVCNVLVAETHFVGKPFANILMNSCFVLYLPTLCQL